MGRHKFRLSDMIPNAWFFKLRDMRVPRCGASPRVAAHHQAPSSSPAASSRAGRVVPATTPKHHHHGATWLPHRTSHYYTPRAGDFVLVGSPLGHHPHPKGSDTSFPPLQLSPPRRSHRRRHLRRRPVRLAPSPITTSSSGGVVSSTSPAFAGGCRCGRKPELVAVEAPEPDTPPCRRDRFAGYSDDEDDDGELIKKPAALAIRAADSSKVITSATEIIIDLRTKKKQPHKAALPPIVTRPARRERPDGCEPEDKHIDVLTHAAARRAASPVTPTEQSIKPVKPRRSVSSARRLKTRANTPRVAVAPKKKCSSPERSPAPTKLPPPPPPLAESFAVVKTSRDPRRDFRESMDEMIAENGIRTAADLEDLLACYLSLNAAEYHDLIVEVFEHVWATLSDIKM